MAKTAPINMRVEPAQQRLLTRAAAVLHQDRTTFVMARSGLMRNGWKKWDG